MDFTLCIPPLSPDPYRPFRLAALPTSLGRLSQGDSPCPYGDSRSSQTFLRDWENDVACADLAVFVPRSVAKDADCVTQNSCAIVGRFGRRAVSGYRRPRRV